MENAILFGNGFNLLTKDCPSWNKLLSDISYNKNTSLLENVPPTLQYEQLFISSNNTSFSDNEETKLKEAVKNRLKNIKTNNFYKLLKETGIKIFLTTNYDHAFFNNDMSMIKDSDGSEKIYSIRRWNKLKTNENYIWLYPIHGDISVVKSIMLGLDHYGGSLAKVQDFVKGNYQSSSKQTKYKVPSIEERINDNALIKIDNYGFKESGSGLISWIDSFFFTNLHIIGLTLDFSEIDIWWLISRYARLKKTGLINNRIYYYPTFPLSEIHTHLPKLRLLEKLNVKVEYHQIITDLETGKPDYESIYSTQINKIKDNLINRSK